MAGSDDLAPLLDADAARPRQPVPILDADGAREVLRVARRIAIVGASPERWRPSNSVMAYLLEHGYECVPINPNATSVLGRPCYPTLEAAAVAAESAVAHSGITGSAVAAESAVADSGITGSAVAAESAVADSGITGSAVAAVSAVAHSGITGSAVAAVSADGPPFDIVDVFRRPEYTPEIARSAVALSCGTLWLQHRIISWEAARIAHEGGLKVVMDRCTAVDHRRLRELSGRP